MCIPDLGYPTYLQNNISQEDGTSTAMLGAFNQTFFGKLAPPFSLILPSCANGITSSVRITDRSHFRNTLLKL